MIWIIATGLLISTILLIMWNMDGEYKSFSFNLALVPFAFAVIFTLLYGIATAPAIPYDYNIPDCPGGHLKHYEYPLGSFSVEEDVVQQFSDHGWSNIIVYTMEDSGFFSSPDRIVSGDCFNP